MYFPIRCDNLGIGREHSVTVLRLQTRDECVLQDPILPDMPLSSQRNPIMQDFLSWFKTKVLYLARRKFRMRPMIENSQVLLFVLPLR